MQRNEFLAYHKRSNHESLGPVLLFAIMHATTMNAPELGGIVRATLYSYCHHARNNHACTGTRALIMSLALSMLPSGE